MGPVDKKKTVKYFFLTRPLLAVMKGLTVTSTIICQREFEKLLMIDMIDYLVQLIYIFFALTYITCYATRSKQ